MNKKQLTDSLYNFIRPSYPEIKINVVDKNDERQIFFEEEKFKVLFPRQRYHYLIHKIPTDFFTKNLENTTWFELAPGERIEDLDYHDDETIESISEIIMNIIENKTNFAARLDSSFTESKAECYGDFWHSKEILKELGFTEKEQFDIFHVFMNKGGYCDCELLYNVFKESQYAKEYWKHRNK